LENTSASEIMTRRYIVSGEKNKIRRKERLEKAVENGVKVTHIAAPKFRREYQETGSSTQ